MFPQQPSARRLLMMISYEAEPQAPAALVRLPAAYQGYPRCKLVRRGGIYMVPGQCGATQMKGLDGQMIILRVCVGGRQGLFHLVLIDCAAGPGSHYQLVRLHPAHCHRHKPVVHMRNFQLRCYRIWTRRQTNLAGDGGIAGAQARQDANDGRMQCKDPGWHLGEGRWGWGRDRAGLAEPPSRG